MPTNRSEYYEPIGLSYVPHDLQSAITENWSAFSSCSERWSPDVPSLGQCVVTACVVQDYLGGDLVRATVPGNGHYFNVIDEKHVDMTRAQFLKTDEIGRPEIVTRATVLGDEFRKSLYVTFAGRVSVDMRIHGARSRGGV